MSSQAPVLSNPRSFWQKAVDGYDLIPLFIVIVVKPLSVWLIVSQYLAMTDYPDLFWTLLASMVVTTCLLATALIGLVWLYNQIDEKG